MRYIRLSPNERAVFWFPIVLPALMGLILGFAEFLADLAGTAIAMDHREELNIRKLLWGDLVKLWDASLTGVTSTAFTVDIWALSTLFASRSAVRPGTAYAYAYAVLGLFAHFIILLLVVGLCYLANMSNSAAISPDIGMPITSNPERDRALAAIVYGIATLFTFFAVLTGWVVRRGMWIHYDSTPDGTTGWKLGSFQARVFRRWSGIYKTASNAALASCERSKLYNSLTNLTKEEMDRLAAAQRPYTWATLSPRRLLRAVSDSGATSSSNSSM